MHILANINMIKMTIKMTTFVCEKMLMNILSPFDAVSQFAIMVNAFCSTFFKLCSSFTEQNAIWFSSVIAVNDVYCDEMAV